jgi:hypothetical protein
MSGCSISQTILDKGFEYGMMKGEKMDSRKMILKLRCFSPLEILTSPFYLQRLLEILFSFLLFTLFSMLRLFENLGILMINKEKNTLQKFLFKWNGMEWLSHDYRNGGVVDISAEDAYLGKELCTPILLGEASEKIWMANRFWKFSKLTMDTSINKAQHKQELLCG